MANKRTPRDLDTREDESRVESWQPPSILPMPDPQPGYEFRWVRTSVDRTSPADLANVSAKFRGGWVPVRREDHPEMMIMSDMDSRWKDGIEVGGLLLCKRSTEIGKQRSAYYERMAMSQQEAVDRNLMRENQTEAGRLMPVFQEKESRVSFGKGRSDD